MCGIRQRNRKREPGGSLASSTRSTLISLIRMPEKLRYSWLDLLLWLATIVLLIPIVARFVESVRRALEDMAL